MAKTKAGCYPGRASRAVGSWAGTGCRLTLSKPPT